MNTEHQIKFQHVHKASTFKLYKSYCCTKGMHWDKIEVVLPPLRTPATYASLIFFILLVWKRPPKDERNFSLFRGKSGGQGGGLLLSVKKGRNLAGPFPFVDFFFFFFRLDNGNGDFPEYHQVSVSESDSGWWWLEKWITHAHIIKG